MATYYHIAHKSYQAGMNLYSFDNQLDMGWEPEWKWDEADQGLDSDVVCLFETRKEAEYFKREYLPSGKLLKIQIAENDDRVRVLRNDEGYPAVMSKIPADLIAIA